MTLTAVSLFAGIGGIDLAMERAGVTVTAAVEIDPAARGVLADRFPHTTLFPDVTKVTADELYATGFVPGRGIIAAGWPCQGNSVAGRRGGMGDPRSGLWRHVVRLLAETRPTWFVGENVLGLLSVNDGDDLAIVRSDLAQLGYWWAERVLDAQYFGVPQRRRRIFFVGHSGDPVRPVQVLLEPEGGGGDPPAHQSPRQEVAATPTAGVSAAGVSAPGRRQEDDVNLVVANALTTREGKGPDSDATTTLIVADVAATLQGGGQRDHRIDAESAAGGHLVTREVVMALTGSGVGTCGPDDNQAQAGHLIATHTTGYCSGLGQRDDSDVIAFQPQAAGDTAMSIGATSPCLNRSQLSATQSGTTVRRLTPLECERLQGLPDDWTATSNGKPQTDSPRYRQCGNSVAVPVVEWIMRRIAAAEDGAS